MTFATPLFWWLAASLVPLAAVYFLKVRPTRKPVTALFLWQSLLTQRATSNLFQRLRHWLSLLLMALAFLLVTGALAQPQLADVDRRDLLIVVDTSASMAATDLGESRIARARDLADELVRGLAVDQRAAIATVDEQLVFAAPVGSDRRTLRETIAAIEVGTRGDDPELLSGLAAEPGIRERYRVLVLSDGGVVPEQVGRPARDRIARAADADGTDDDDGDEPLIELFAIGAEPENIGIVTADLQRLPDGSTALLAQLHSTYAEAVERDLVVAMGAEDFVIGVMPVTVQPGLNPSEVFTFDEDAAGPWFLRLDEHSDHLAADDRIALALPPLRPVPVAVEAEGPFFLESCVQAFADSHLLELVTADARVTVAHGLSPTADTAIIIGPAGTGPWWESLGDPITAIPEVVVDDHPLLRHLEAEHLRFRGARAMRVPAAAEVVIRDAATGSPLLYQLADGQRRAVVVNADPFADELYFSIAFPVLIHDAVVHLVGREDGIQACYRAGERAPVPDHADGPSLLIAPDGERRELDGPRTPPLAELGHYRLEGPTGAWTLGVGLLDSGESALGVADDRLAGRPVARGEPLATWLLLVAVILLALECLLYHRRKVG